MQSNGCTANEGPSGIGRDSMKGTHFRDKPRLSSTLKVNIIEAKDLPSRYSNPLCIGVFVDRNETYRCHSAKRNRNDRRTYFGEEFVMELGEVGLKQIIFLVSEYPGKSRSAFARLTLRTQDLMNPDGVEKWFPLKSYSAQNNVTGKICVNVTQKSGEFSSATQLPSSVQIQVLDYSDLELPQGTRGVDLYALITPHIGGERLKPPERLKLSAQKNSSQSDSTGPSSLIANPPSITIDLSSVTLPVVEKDRPSKPHLRLCLWHDFSRGLQSYFHGEVRIPLDQHISPNKISTPWYYLKPRSSEAKREDCGELKLRVKYSLDHILPLDAYKELREVIMNSVPPGPIYTPMDRLRPIPLLEHCNMDELDTLATPLLKLLLHWGHLRPMIRAMAALEILKCQDPNALFRNSSLASNLVNVLMKFVGLQYLSSTLKPCIDKIYSEQLNCEIDPSKLQPDASLQQNQNNLVLYAELVFSRVVDSNHRCPKLIKDVLSDLRQVTHTIYPSQQRLVLSSFIILRFFSLALTNPKAFKLSRDNPTPTVHRTLVLISKILQRQSNFVVNESLNESRLQVKEPWLSPVLTQFMKENHKLAMCKLLDRISCVGGENSISGESVSIVKEGMLNQRFHRQKRCFEWSWMTARRRYCCLTDTELFWARNKGEAPLDRVSLCDVGNVSVADETVLKCKHVLQVSTTNHMVYLAASDSLECNEWVETINRQIKRERQASQAVTIYQHDDIDVEKELENIFMLLVCHNQTLKYWKEVVEGSADPNNRKYPDLPSGSVDDPGAGKECLSSINSLLYCALNIENSHRNAARQLLAGMHYGSKDLPIGDDNYLLIKSRIEPHPLFANIFI